MTKRPAQTAIQSTRMPVRGRTRRHAAFALRTAAAVALGVTLAVSSSGGSASAGSKSPFAEAEAYSQCIRKHGVPNFPDPVKTPSGSWGYKTQGIDPNSAAFQGALLACKDLPSPWNSIGQQLTHAQQRGWLKWAQCIRNHGVSDFPDPTFSGRKVYEPGVELNSPPLQSAMNDCKSKMPSVGGLGG
ncbi:MAG: hypothetical protein WA614_13050 [Acidimicrobiales bacterium]